MMLSSLAVTLDRIVFRVALPMLGGDAEYVRRKSRLSAGGIFVIPFLCHLDRSEGAVERPIKKYI
jgi:hypothetical protein